MNNAIGAVIFIMGLGMVVSFFIGRLWQPWLFRAILPSLHLDALQTRRLFAFFPGLEEDDEE